MNNLETKKFEEYLFQEPPYSIQYIFKTLLREIKSLDSCLTNYLVEDAYNSNDISKEDVYCNLLKFKDLLDFTMSNSTLVGKESASMQYAEHYKGLAKSHFDAMNERQCAWTTLLGIKEKLEANITDKRFRIVFKKGYDFGVGKTNFCSLEILYDEYVSPTSVRVYPILSVTSNTGWNVRVYKSKDYYEFSGEDLDNYRLNIDRILSYDEKDSDDLVDDVVKLIKKVVKYVDADF